MFIYTSTIYCDVMIVAEKLLLEHTRYQTPSSSQPQLCDYLIFILKSLIPLASPPADFTPLTTQLTFTSDTNRICHNISVLDDVLYEDPESFNVTLITSDSSVMIDPDRTTGRIVVNDNDGKWNYISIRNQIFISATS